MASWQLQDAKARFTKVLNTAWKKGPQNRHAPRRGDGRPRAHPRLEAARTGRAAHIKEFAAWSWPLLSQSSAETRALKRGRIQVIHYLRDTSVVCELRKPNPHGAVLAWLQSLREDQIYISAVTMGRLQRGIERTRRRNADKAREIEIWLDQMEASRNLLLMDAACFREWARRSSRGSEHLLEENAMIAATGRVHRLKVATRNPSDFALLGVDLFNPFKN